MLLQFRLGFNPNDSSNNHHCENNDDESSHEDEEDDEPEPETESQRNIRYGLVLLKPKTE